ncbi:Scr1 family TA system antitoxin-like transcriptional regulator [Kitasatospora sp. NPDC059795]|uniref:helix-turn-helix domain-containing protein n=1 Tax=Kitasatospora sp. NPDC059795 TaxID=3346949 RepID=UPI00364FD245
MGAGHYDRQGLTPDGSCELRRSTLQEEPEVDATLPPALRFGAELRRSRVGRGWSQDELARRMQYSAGLVSYVERARKPVSLNFAVKADEVFGAGGRFEELFRRYLAANLLEGFEEFAEAEGKCRRLQAYELGVIPGLFQTPAYASALAAAAVQRSGISQEQADARVGFLAVRQKLLDRPVPPLVHVVMDESCIRRPVGGPAVMEAQLAHLEKLAKHPRITIQVAPFDLGEYAPFTMPLVLLTLPNRVVIGYAESQARGHLERNRDTVTAWARDYDQLQVESLSTVASLALIQAVRKELSHEQDHRLVDGPVGEEQLQQQRR